MFILQAMSDNNTVNKQRIAKNTLALYFRMLVTTIVSLYTTRVVLSTLGVDDFGIYGLAGGVVSILGFLNASMSGATSRFITFELAKNDNDRLSKTFSSAMVAHLLIAAIVLLISETIGLWFLCNKLVIPESRMFAAHCVFQLSILSALLTITQVPYNSCIIAHEKMDVYAYVEIINVVLKLLIVYLLTLWDADKLILYAVLVLAVSTFIMGVYRTYCIRKFEECHFKLIWNPGILKPMLSFSGWDLFGNMSAAVRQQGTNFLINMFFGVAFNAASSVAGSVQGVIHGFCYNTLTAFRPQIIKQYSIGKIQQSVELIYEAARISTALLVLMVIPFTFEMDFIMSLWLGTPPDYASLFCIIMLWSGCLNMFENAVGIGIQATGKLKTKSFLTGIIYLMSIPIIWLCYKYGMPVETAYYISIVICSCSISTIVIILKRYINSFSPTQFVMKAILPNIVLLGITYSCVFPISVLLDDGFVRLILITIADIIFGGLTIFFVLLNRNQRGKILEKIKKQ